uniref:C2 domain-containing protein n=1 Tax=Oryza punctata TaxID=4537 RepID=A0A0E0JIX5_ORYPU
MALLSNSRRTHARRRHRLRKTLSLPPPPIPPTILLLLLRRPAMAYRVLELTLVSASDLKKVTLFSRMRVFAIASISGSNVPMPMHGTHADSNGGSNPAWNTVLHFPVPARLDTRGLALHVQLRARRSFGGHRDVGDVFVPLDDLLAGAHDGGEPKPASYQVRRPMSGRSHGTLYFCYRFTDVKHPALEAIEAASATSTTKQEQYVPMYVQNSDEKATEKSMSPVTAYPPPSNAAVAYPPVVPYGAPYGGGYPPQQKQPYGYAAPPPYAYNAVVPPPPASYGYASAQQPAPRRGGRMGMGLGLGLLGGAVGGMMLGEMVGDMEADAAYDAGFNDALEF